MIAQLPICLKKKFYSLKPSVVVLETMVLVSSGLEAKSASLGLGLDTYGLGLAFKQDQELINFYCAISASIQWSTNSEQTQNHSRAYRSTVFIGSLKLEENKVHKHKVSSQIFADFSYVNLWGHIMLDWENLFSHLVFLKCNRHFFYLDDSNHSLHLQLSWYSVQCPCMWLHGHWTLYQLSCRCSEWFDSFCTKLWLHRHCRSWAVDQALYFQHIMHFYVTGYKFGMMVLVSLSFSRCVNFVGRGQVLVLKAVVLVLNLLVLVLITTLLKPWSNPEPVLGTMWWSHLLIINKLLI